MRVYLAGCEGSDGTVGEAVSSHTVEAVAADLGAVAGLPASSVTITAVGCAGNASSFLTAPALAEINSAIQTGGARALAAARALPVAPPNGQLIVECVVLAPLTNGGLAASSLNVSVNNSLSSTANVADRLDGVNSMRQEALPRTIVVRERG